MQDFTDIEKSKDLGNKRSLTLENGNKIHFERTDPYGFWKVHYDKGQVPEKLKGNYTSFDIAMVAVKSYLAIKNPESEEPTVKKPRAKLSNGA